MEVPQWDPALMPSARHISSLNPYSNGSTTMGDTHFDELTSVKTCLNPYSNGSTTMGLS